MTTTDPADVRPIIRNPLPQWPIVTSAPAAAPISAATNDMMNYSTARIPISGGLTGASTYGLAERSDLFTTSPAAPRISDLPGLVAQHTETTPTAAPPSTSVPGSTTGAVGSGGTASSSDPTGSTTATNSGGAGLSGNGPLIDALTALLGGGQMQSPLDAVSSPSTAALSALAPTSAQTSSTSDPAVIVLVVGIVAIGGVWAYFKFVKHKGAGVSGE